MINIVDLSRVDLNLLVTFQCLLEEGNVTRSAERMHLTQGAVSSSLKRLRKQFADELFVRSGGRMLPTKRALELAPAITEALKTISHAITAEQSFEPEASDRLFNIALSDDIESYLAPRLVKTTHDRGLQTRFTFHQSNSHLWRNALDNPDIDIVICSEPQNLTSHFNSEVLFSSSYSCMYDGPRLHLPTPLTREEYLSHDHVRISYDGRRGFVDDLLDKEGIRRRVCVSFTHFAGVLGTMLRSDVITVLPTFAALALSDIAGLTVSPVPFQVPSFRTFLIWRVEPVRDPALEWLRSFINEMTQDVREISGRVTRDQR